MNEDRDPILDACLDEVLAGRSPPDLTARILQAWAVRGHVNGSTNSLPGAPPAAAPPPVLASSFASATPAAGQPVVELNTTRGASHRAGRRKSSAGWQFAVVAASLLVVAVIGIAAFNASQQQVVDNRPTEQQGPAVVNAEPRTAPAVRPRAVSPTSPRNTPGRKTPGSNTPGSNTPGSEQPQVVRQHSPSDAGGSNVAATNVPSAVTPAPSETPAPSPLPLERKYADPSPNPEVISFVNAELTRSWTENGVKPSPAATEAEWCRRLFVRVLGRIPTIDELKAFQADKSPNKRERLVDRLLSDEDYVAEYASHWATIWCNVLIGRTGGQAESLASRDGLEQFLRASLARNKPYDELVLELLTATGSSKPGSEGYNGAVNFLLDGMNEENTLASARVSRVFMGQQLQCAQCHAHPSQDWSQDDFWSFNAFFRQMQATQEGAGEAGSVRLTNVDFPGEGRGSTDGEVFYETPQGLLKSAFPRFIDGTALPTSGELAEVDRRAELAKLVVQSPELPKALVNRMWSHFFGYGFTQPVDDMGPNATPSHPELLDRLAQEFIARDFDLKSVIRWIALSDPFSRSSKLSDLASKDMPEAGNVALFSRYYSRQMQAEEVYNSLVQAAQVRKTAGAAAEIEQARVDWLAQFSRNMDTDDAMEEQHFNGSMRQSLIMMNGDLMSRAVSSQHEGLLKTVAASPMKFEKKVEHLFLSALSREPSKREQQAAATILKSSGGNEQAALEDIWWAVLNSNEFILDH